MNIDKEKNKSEFLNELPITSYLELLGINYKYKNNQIIVLKSNGTEDTSVRIYHNRIIDFSSKLTNSNKSISGIDLYINNTGLSFKEAKNELYNRLNGYSYSNIKPEKITAPAPKQENENEEFYNKEKLTLSVNTQSNQFKEIKALYPTLNKLEIRKKIVDLLTKVYSIFELSKQHYSRFIKKRGFIPNDNYKSYSQKRLNDSLTKEEKRLSELLDLYKDDRKNSIIIFFRDTNNEIISYRRYLFDAPKGRKKLPFTGALSIPYRLELLSNPEVKKIVICEGEEKSDVGNYYIQAPEVAFISIQSISNRNSLKPYLKYLNDKEIYILFDRKRELKEGSEEKNAYQLSELLTENNISNKICRLEINSKLENESDLDSWLLTIPENKKTQKLLESLDTAIHSQDYFKSYVEPLKEKKDLPKRNRKKISHQKPENKQLNLFDLSDGRDILKEKITNYLTDETNGALLVKATAGIGKSHIIKSLSVNYNYYLSLPNKDLRKESHNDIPDSIEIKSIYDEFKEVLESKISDKTKLKEATDRLEELINKGYTNKALEYLKTQIKGFHEIQNKIEKILSKTNVITHSKLICSLSEISSINDILIIDEDITKNLVKQDNISIDTIANYINYIVDDNLKSVFRYLKDYLEETKLKTVRTAFYQDFNEFINVRISVNENGLLELIKGIKNTSLNQIEISKDLKKESSYLPDKNLFYRLVNVIKNLDKCKESIEVKRTPDIKTIEENEETKKSEKTNYIEITTKIKVNFDSKKKVIILDATAKKEYLESFGFKFHDVVNVNVKLENTKVKLCHDKTFTKSSLIQNNQVDNNFMSNLKELCKDKEKTLLIMPKTLREKMELEHKELLEEFNIIVGHYGKDNRATNNYADCKRVIVTQVNIDYEHIKKLGRVVYPEVQNFKTKISDKGTGYILKNGSELFIQDEIFEEDKLNNILIQYSQAEMIQGIFRALRNHKEQKEIVLLGHLSFKEIGIVPDEIIEYKKLSNNPREEIIEEIILNLYSKYSFLNREMILSEIIVNQSILQALNIDEHLMTGWFDTLKNLKSPQTLMNTKRQRFPINNLKRFLLSFNDDKVLNLIRKKSNNSIKVLLDKLDFKEVNIPLVDKPKNQILYKSDLDILTAKEYFKDILLKKAEKITAPAPQFKPENKIINLDSKLELDTNNSYFNDLDSLKSVASSDSVLLTDYILKFLNSNLPIEQENISKLESWISKSKNNHESKRFIYQKIVESYKLVNTCVSLKADNKTTLPMEYSKQFFNSFDFKNYEHLWLQDFFISKVKNKVEIDFDRIRSYDYFYILPLSIEFNFMYKSLNLLDCFFLIAALYKVDIKDISLEKTYLLDTYEMKKRALDSNNKLINSHIKTTDYIDNNSTSNYKVNE